MSKFDELIYKQLELARPQERVCRFSGQKFYVRSEDIDFYKKMGVPLPTLCPDERLRRKFANCSTGMFYNVSAATGERIISMYPPEWKFEVYEPSYWFSDRWDPMDFGVDINGGTQQRARTIRFWELFKKLQVAVPRLALYSDGSNENSEFTNNSMRLKNCYLTFNSTDSENLWYVYCGVNCRDSIGGFDIIDCENCYECREAYNCYECFWCDDVKNCRQSYWLTDCRDCADCFMGQGLRHKQYCWRNEQLSKEEYKNRLNEIDLGSWQAVNKLHITNDKLRTDYVGARSSVPDRKYHNENSENVAKSDYIKNSRNVFQSFYILDSENIAYSEGFMGYKDTYDCAGGLGGERCYESMMVSSASNYEIKFCLNVSDSRNMEYCDTCSNCRDCFGCIGLRHQQYCILNKQYSREKYEQLLDQIKAQMLKDGDYGEFFSPELAVVPYNVSEALINGPDKGNLESACQYGYPMMDVACEVATEVGEAINVNDLPDNIDDIDESIVKNIYYDPAANKNFRYLPPELAWHKKYGLACPRNHPLERIRKAREYFPRGWWWPIDD
ncbi:MAG: hypothetical protein WC570_03850 [Patescibacteria group bacterium]